MESADNKARIQWIDIAKCIAILGVVLAHTSSHYLCAFVQTYNVAFFFFLSGLTFCRDDDCKDQFRFDNRSVKIFASRLFKSILLPYFLWGLISIAVYFIVGQFIQIGANSTDLLNNILALLYGNSNSEFFEWNRPLWFLPALALIWISWFAYLKLTSYFCISLVLRGVGCLALILIGGVDRISRLQQYAICLVYGT